VLKKERDSQTDPLPAYCLYPNQATAEISRDGVELLSRDGKCALARADFM